MALVGLVAAAVIVTALLVGGMRWAADRRRRTAEESLARGRLVSAGHVARREAGAWLTARNDDLSDALGAVRARLDAERDALLAHAPIPAGSISRLDVLTGQYEAVGDLVQPVSRLIDGKNTVRSHLADLSAAGLAAPIASDVLPGLERRRADLATALTQFARSGTGRDDLPELCTRAQELASDYAVVADGVRSAWATAFPERAAARGSELFDAWVADVRSRAQAGADDGTPRRPRRIVQPGSGDDPGDQPW